MSVGSKWNRNGTLKGLSDQLCQDRFDQLSKNVQDLLPFEQHDPLIISEEDMLIKFLVARNFDVSASESMLRNYIKWRNEYGANMVLTSAKLPEMFATHCDVGFGGHGKEGHPIYVEFLQGKPTIELLKAQPWEEQLLWNVLVMERQRQVMKHWGMGQMIVIVDLKDLSTSCYTSSALFNFTKKTSQHNQDNYPETLRHFFFINAPMAATGVWKSISPFLDPVVRDKVHILGPNEWRDRVTKYVDPDNLPERLGGKAGWYPLSPDVRSFQLPPPPAK